MKIYVRIILTFSLLFSLTGCFELIEDTTIHNDGSGDYKLTLNLSASQTRLNSIMALDSIDGKKVPSEEEIQQELLDFVDRMNAEKGISNTTSSFDSENWIFKFSCSFDSLSVLKSAIYEASQKWSSQKNASDQKLNDIDLNFSNNTYTRKFSANVDEKVKEKVKKDEDFGKLSEGKCVFIQRFDSPIKSINKDYVRVAKNKKASMMMTTPDKIINNPAILDYSVELSN
tara:strand:+ start:43196 stop:43882 length:687 start_codon:yes stop_codon:yes gene_type:complete